MIVWSTPRRPLFHLVLSASMNRVVLELGLETKRSGGWGEGTGPNKTDLPQTDVLASIGESFHDLVVLPLFTPPLSAFWDPVAK